MSINDIKSVFIVGIKGVGMANIAILLKDMGKDIGGSDTSEEFTTDMTLHEKGISVTNSFEPHHIPHNTDI